jgi:hypothetical protein
MRTFIILSGILIGGLAGHGAYLIVSTAPPKALFYIIALLFILIFWRM